MKLRKPPEKSHKGENGKLLIIGGSRKYHGAPFFSAVAARRFVDLIYFYPGEKNEMLIDSMKRIPEVIVAENPVKITGYDCVLFGIGLSNAKFGTKKLYGAKKLVVDGDGLKKIRNKIPKGAILTPHENEFRMLFGIPGTAENVEIMAEKHRCTILKKGTPDIISDGTRTKTNALHNPGMTKGGTGDVLSGLVAALYCTNPAFESAYLAAKINGTAGNRLKKRYGFNFCASDLAEELSEASKKFY